MCITKKLVLLGSVLVLGVRVCVLAEEQAVESSSQRIVFGTVAVVRDSTVREDLASRVAEYLRSNLSVAVAVGYYDGALTALSEAEQLRALQNYLLLGESNAWAIALARESSEVEPRVLLLRETRTGIVNLSRLQDEVRQCSDPREQFNRLVEKETMRTLGYLVGLTPCPNPHCAMSGYILKPGTDVQGRNYCPACREKADQALGDKGSVRSIRNGSMELQPAE